MEHPQVAVKHPRQHLPGGGTCLRSHAGPKPDLGHLQVPVAVLGPDGAVKDARGLGELEAGVGRIGIAQGSVAAGQDPVLRGPEAIARGQRKRHVSGQFRGSCAQHEARGVPQLVGEVAGPLEARWPKALIGAWGRAVDEREAQGIGADLVHDYQRVDDVALGLGHLLAVRVADQAAEIDHAEGLLPGQPLAQHHHARDPEEDDVVAGLHHLRRVVRPQVVRAVRPTQRGEGPQSAGEPGIEGVLVLCQLEGAALHAPARPGLHVGDGDVALRAVPGRDAVAPPQLPADVPVVDVLQPVEEDLLEALGHEARAAFAYGLHGALRHGLDIDEPLRLQARLHDVVAALTAADGHLVVLHLDEVARGVEILEDAHPALLAAEALVWTGVRVHRGGVGHDVDAGQAVPLTGREVGVVVSRRDLHGTGAELALDEVIGHDGHIPVHERDAHQATHQGAIAIVLRVHRHGSVTEDGLRAGGRHDDALVTAGLTPRHRARR